MRVRISIANQPTAAIGNISWGRFCRYPSLFCRSEAYDLLLVPEEVTAGV
jgi:hypothetical protein